MDGGQLRGAFGFEAHWVDVSVKKKFAYLPFFYSRSSL
jgi:hypothetical protein